MPHQRFRQLEPLLKKSISFSGITGIFGHRQVGKTTLAAKLGGRYETLDNPLSLVKADTDPVGFLEEGRRSGLLVIDECQLSPVLFPSLKEWMRTHPQPGQFLLTGSVRFSSRIAIRESLTGRLIAWELLPMDLSERTETALPNQIPKLLKARTVEIELKPRPQFSEKVVIQALEQGGLPGIFAVRDSSIRAQRFETMLNTILERDLRLLLKTTLSYSTLRNLVAALALRQAQPLEWASLSRQTRVSAPSLRKLIQAFEAMFLIRQMPTEGTERKSVLFFEDQGEATYMAGNRYDEGTQLLRFLYSELRHQTHYRPELNAQMFQFRNRGGAHVPLCFRSGDSVLGIIPTIAETPEPGSLATARAFLKAYPHSKLLFTHLGSKDTLIDSRIRCLGAKYLL